MSLPNPGMDAVPFTALPASFLDDIIENVEALATGSGLDTNAISASKLATNAIKLGYTAITSNFSTASTSAVQVTSLTSTVTIPSGGRSVKITAYAPSLYNGTISTNVILTIWDGTVGSGTQLGSAVVSAPAANAQAPVTAMAIVTPSAGSKTYNIGLNASGGGTANLSASATGPAFILVELI